MKDAKELIHRIFTRHHIWITFCLVCFAGIIAAVVLYGDYRQAQLKGQLLEQTGKLASTTAALNMATKGLQDQINNIVAQNNLLNNTV